jgi:DNA modification methylase
VAKAVKTTHKIYFKNASDLKDLPDESLHLMVTSPPYPMIEMWDDVFSEQKPSRKKMGTELSR